jgi:thiol-disulfide isomerase/thioredoxin
MTQTRRLLSALSFIPLAIAQTAQQPPQPQPATQSPVVRSIRFKLSAGDLPSAESLLEECKANSGTDAVYIVAASWVARGAALMHGWTTAEHYSAIVREMTAHAADTDLLYALGSALEVHAQVLEARGQKQEAADFIDSQLKLHADAPVSFRCRLYKRRNLIALAGQPAPVITADDGTAWKPARGQPSVLFLWANYCSDCLGEEPALARFWQKYRGRGIQLAAVTRIYDDDDPAADRAKTAEVWRTSYKELADVPVIISTETMLRYGGSSTPTFVLIDGNGVVRAYLPYRLTEERLEQEAEKLLGKPEAPGATHRSLQSLSMSASSESRESVAPAFADCTARRVSPEAGARPRVPALFRLAFGDTPSTKTVDCRGENSPPGSSETGLEAPSITVAIGCYERTLPLSPPRRDVTSLPVYRCLSFPVSLRPCRRGAWRDGVCSSLWLRPRDPQASL